MSSYEQFSSSTVLVTTMRADFLGNALSYPPLADVLRDDVKIRSMTPEELREVIEKPAQKLGVSFESGLVERILKDVDKEPGNLPLLEFALTELWKKRTSKQLTHQAYQEIGEVSGALTRYADREFSKFKPEEQERVRRIFIQLVRPGEGTEDTRRVATKAELKETHWNLVKQLADARLVVTSRTVVTSAKNAEQETVEVVHEALIRNWGQLKGWMETDREFRAWQERIRAAMGHWQEMNRDKGLLLRGAALVQAQEKLKERREELSEAEQEFIGLSEALQVMEEKQKQRIIRVLVVFSVFISGLAVTVFGLWREAQIGEENANLKAEIAGLKSRLVSGEKSLDVQLGAIEVNQKLQQAKKPKIDILIQGVNLLRQNVNQIREINHLTGHHLPIYGVFHRPTLHKVTFSPDGKYLAMGSWDKTVKLWTLDGNLVKTLTGHQSFVYHVTFSPDGKYLASASADKTVKLWTLDGNLVKTLTGHLSDVYHVIFSPDVKYLASASWDKTVKLWTREGNLVKTLTGHQSFVYHVTFSPDGKYLASASRDKTVKLWTLDGNLVKTLTGHQSRVVHKTFSPPNVNVIFSPPNVNVIFSPDVKYLASANSASDNTVKLWKLEGGLVDTLTGHQSSVYHVAFSPDGKYLASASGDKTVKLWTLDGNLVDTLTGHQSSVYHVAFSSDGKYLASASGDKTVKLWTLDGNLVDTLTGHQSSVYHVTFSPNGKYLASASGDKTIKLWMVDQNLVGTLTGHHQKNVSQVTFSPDGKYLASASSDKTVKLWTAEGKLIEMWTGEWTLGDKLSGNRCKLNRVTFKHVTFSSDEPIPLI
ncbi:MAG: WD40 repeat domain-containing protein [Moorea sp. SIO2I5]|nr:WD40 repeat domain-containing protein [Moorena sp. SIO2I5]